MARWVANSLLNRGWLSLPSLGRALHLYFYAPAVSTWCSGISQESLLQQVCLVWIFLTVGYALFETMYAIGAILTTATGFE